MTSQITRKMYDEFIESPKIIKDISPFYISGKSGTIRLEKLHNEEFKFTWFRNHTSKYVEYCVAYQDTHNYIYFFFFSFEDVIENVKNNYYGHDGLFGALSVSGPLLVSKYFYETKIYGTHLYILT
jgi:hypothetical protein